MSKATTDDPICVYRWEKAVDGADSGEKAVKEAYAVIQPGDLIVGATGSGHAMIYVGDCFGDGTNYIIHCAGKKVDPKTGVDAVEKNGGIRRDPAGTYCFGETPGKGLHTKYSTFVILRPWKAKDFSGHTVTEHAKTRLKYPRLRVDKEASLKIYNSPVTGQDITVTLTAFNNGTSAITGLPVTEYLPTGATLKSATGAQNADGKLTWTLDIPAGEQKSVSYTVTVTAKRGETVTIPAGKVDGLDTRSMTYLVSGAKLSREKLDKLASLGSTSKRETRSQLRALSANDVQFAVQVYGQVLGVDLGLPGSFNTLMKGMFHRVSPAGKLKDYPFMWELNKSEDIPAEYRAIYDMKIPEHFGGYSVFIGTDPAVPAHSMYPVDRTTDYREEFYEPGDIFIELSNEDKTSATDPKHVEVFIYLGSDSVLACGDGCAEVCSFGNSIERSLKNSVILALRPTLIYDDINADVSSMPFTDVETGSWYYDSVKELYFNGTVSGMTATTFAPNGKLTYGQALKLIACGLGFSEQSPTGAHWASGYLQLAKKRVWLTGDVDLDAPISRCALCSIAAKAKGLSAQPESNPFTDTRDASVLALYKAGVINGMTATTFAPDATLTRAQISKIICALRAVR
ncbi:MAG: S-layer homology domain-containing protein [Oscillospiraceae bacterium]|nr:S-layer homology domain-containing protein [Oscillospiraceae bacterium]